MIQKPPHFETMEASKPETGKESDEPQEGFDSLQWVDLDWKWRDGILSWKGVQTWRRK